MKGSISIAVIGFALFTGCALESEELLPDDDPTPTTSTRQPGEARITAGTWQRGARNYCFDLFAQPCSDSVPVNQCPDAAPGQPCSGVPGYCHKVEEPYRLSFHDYYCYGAPTLSRR